MLYFNNQILQKIYKTSEINFNLPSRSTFYKYKCPCVKKSIAQSCVDIIFSAQFHYMYALNKFLKTNSTIKERLTTCKRSQHSLPRSQHWQSLLNGRVGKFLMCTSCPSIPHPNLTCNISNNAYIPSFIEWKCANGSCIKCGIEKKKKN